MWQYNYTLEPDELYHFGIKGQEWGKRRFQNNDGSLTAAGRKRYAQDTYKNENKQALVRYQSGLKKLQISGKGNDTDAVTKLSKQYDADRKAAKDKYKAEKKSAKDARKVEKEQRKDARKAEKEQLKADIKDYKETGMVDSYKVDAKTGKTTVTSYRNSKGEKVGQEYVTKVMNKSRQQTAVKVAAGAAATYVGLKIVKGALIGSAMKSF